MQLSWFVSLETIKLKAIISITALECLDITHFYHASALRLVGNPCIVLQKTKKEEVHDQGLNRSFGKPTGDTRRSR
jgi:hypothetical protein